MTASSQGAEPPVVTCPDCSAGYDLAKFRKLPLVDMLTLDGKPVRRLESRTCGGRVDVTVHRISLAPHAPNYRKRVVPEPCRAELAIWIDRDGDPVTDPWIA